MRPGDPATSPPSYPPAAAALKGDGPVRGGTAAAVLAVYAAVVVGWPAVCAAWTIGAGASASRAGAGSAGMSVSFAPRLLVESIAWAGLIALLAAGLGWPMAWAVRRWGARAVAFIAAPMLLPPYLAYAGWNLLRAPDTPLGAWIEELAQDGFRWAPVAVGRGLAIVGLSLWAAPAAGVITGLALQRSDDAVLDQLRLDAGRGVRFALASVRLAGRGLAAAVLLITLLMLGSAVPVHLAQIPTWSIHLWMGLDLAPPQEAWRVWYRAWPLVFIAAAGLMALRKLVSPGTGWAEPRARRSRREAERGVGPARRRGRRRAATGLIGPVVVVGLGTIVPLVLFAAHLKSARSIPTFWRVSGPAIADSAGVALVVAAISAVVVVLVWAALDASGGGPRPGRRGYAARGVRAVTRLSLAGMLLAALLPGVLVGSAVGAAWRFWPGAGETAAAVVLAHLARFSAIPALAGVWLHGLEPREDREARALDGAKGVRGWVWAGLPAHAEAIAGVAVAAGLLSFFEVEAAVVVQPPGLENLSRQILGFLHFARTEELSAAAITLIAGGAVMAAAVAIAAARVLGGRRT